MTVLEVIQRSAEFLAKKGVDSPRLQIELLLAHVLNMPRLNLYVNFERPLAESEIDRVRALVKRRANREPLQHIIGSVSFCGLELAVTPDVLIPRPETELLADRAALLLKALALQSRSAIPALGGTGYPPAWPTPLRRGEGQPVPSGNLPDGPGAVPMINPGADFIATPAAIPVGRLPTGAGRLPAPPISQTGSQAAAPLSVLDFGTGTGCLAIYLARQAPAARILALDVSRAALDVARDNAVRHGVANQIQFLQGDGLDALPEDARFDLIVSNPPYIPTAEIETLAPEVRDHDPRLALDGGSDGLKFYRDLGERAGAFLSSSGRMLCEFGDGQAEAIRMILTGYRWLIEAIESDYNARPRIVIARQAES